MPVFKDIQGRNDALIGKALDGLVAVAPATAAAITTPFTGTTNALALLPTGYSDLGRLTDDGLTHSRTPELSELAGWGATEPVRIDTRRIPKSFTCSAMETKKLTKALYLGMSLSATITPNVGGVVEYVEPDQPVPNYVRAITYAKDENANGEFYTVRFYPRARVVPNGDQVWSDGDQAMTYPLSFIGTRDAVAGFTVKEWTGGPGASGLNTAMGYV